MAKQLRGLILDAASELSLEVGWSAVTMVRVAGRVGVSRQTIYNEVGSKARLAQLVVDAANERLLTLLGQVVEPFPGSGATDIRAGFRRLIGAIAADPQLTALVGGLLGVDSGALPLAGAGTHELVEELAEELARSLGGLELDLTAAERSMVSSALVRLVLCAVAQPGTSGRAADDLAWVATRLLASANGIKPIG